MLRTACLSSNPSLAPSRSVSLVKHTRAAALVAAVVAVVKLTILPLAVLSPEDNHAFELNSALLTLANCISTPFSVNFSGESLRFEVS